MGHTEQALSGVPEARGDVFTQGGGAFWAQRVQSLAHMGRRDEAGDILKRFLDARALGQPDDPTSANVLRYLLETAVVLQDAEAARVIEGRMAPLAALLHTEADMIYNIGRLCGGAAVLQGETEKARAYYQQALDVCTRARFRPELALTRLEVTKLLLAHYPQQQAEAQQHLDFAINEFREMKMQPSLERALKHKGLLHA